MACPDNPPQCYEQDCTWYDKRDTDETFGECDYERDWKAPIGMGLSRIHHKAAGVMDEPMENAEKHAFAYSFIGPTIGPDADIHCLPGQRQIPAHFRQISSAQYGYTSFDPSRGNKAMPHRVWRYESI